jgi:hypothetical protein
MKRCPKCGDVFLEEYDFCLQDGARLIASTGGDRFETVPTVLRQNSGGHETSNKRTNYGSIFLAAIVFLLLGITGTYFFFKIQGGGNDSGGVNPSGGSVTPTAAKDPATPTPSPTPVPTPNKAQLIQLINGKIKSMLSKDGQEEGDKKFRKILYGDLDADGDEDVVVHYNWTFTGGNGWGTSLMALTLENSEYSFASNTVVGAKMGRSTELISVKNGRINLKTMSYTEDDAACCPTIEGSAVYTLRGGQLIETKKAAE